MNLRKLQAKKMTEVTKEEMERIANVERFKVEVSFALASEVERQQLQRVELGDKIGKSKSFITKILNGSHNFTLETLADACWALGYAVHITLGRDYSEMRKPVPEIAIDDLVYHEALPFHDILEIGENESSIDTSQTFHICESSTQQTAFNHQAGSTHVEEEIQVIQA